MAAPAGNPYAAPKVSVSDAAPRLGVGTRAARALAFVGNAFLLLLPLFFLFSNRRLDTGFFVMAGYCAMVAAASTMALAFRDRFSFWAGLSVSALGLVLVAVLLVYLVASGDSDSVALLFLAVPTALSFFAILLVRRARGPSDDTVASRR
jgi:predicted permease